MYAPQDATLIGTAPFATVTRHRQRCCVRACKRKGGERKRERRKRKRERGNKIWNSGYRVWDRDNTGAGEIDIE
jgi:hypothetical protein